jgi:hypothetical protein
MSDLIDRYYELRQHLGIDMMELEHAFMITPTAIQDAAELAAKANNAQAAAKHTVDIVKAEASERIRSQPIHGKDPSEARIASIIPLDHEVQEAWRQLATATYESDICDALYQSLREQGFLLSKTADLVIAGFISPTTVHEQRRAEIHAARVAANNKSKNLARPS